MAAIATERVTHVHHWNESLFSFRTTRDPGFRFENGHFVMLGLPIDGRPLLRAYSIASPNWEEHLEFLSIKVPNGPLTSRLQNLAVGDEVLVSRKPTGTLVLHDLKPGRHLYLLGTGTGLAPFMSIIDQIADGSLATLVGLPPLDPASDRFMLCGSPGMLHDTRALLDARGFTVSPHIGEPGDYVIERAFVEK